MLYACIVLDVDFLDRVMGVGEGVCKVDEFTGQLCIIWKVLRDEGSLQSDRGTLWTQRSC